jgi:hypothetical protein
LQFQGFVEKIRHLNEDSPKREPENREKDVVQILTKIKAKVKETQQIVVFMMRMGQNRKPNRPVRQGVPSVRF